MIKKLEIDCKDFLQDVAFDYYGTKMAICSSDRLITVYDKKEGDNWELVYSWEVNFIFYNTGP